MIQWYIRDSLLSHNSTLVHVQLETAVFRLQSQNNHFVHLLVRGFKTWRPFTCQFLQETQFERLFFYILNIAITIPRYINIIIKYKYVTLCMIKGLKQQIYQDKDILQPDKDHLTFCFHIILLRIKTELDLYINE